jgi:hypothetical protein
MGMSESREEEGSGKAQERRHKNQETKKKY